MKRAAVLLAALVLAGLSTRRRNLGAGGNRTWDRVHRPRRWWTRNGFTFIRVLDRRGAS